MSTIELLNIRYSSCAIHTYCSIKIAPNTLRKFVTRTDVNNTRKRKEEEKRNKNKLTVI